MQVTFESRSAVFGLRRGAVGVEPVLPSGPNGNLTAGIVGCRPNPLRQSALLTYRLASPEPVSLELFDTAGRRVRTIWRGQGGPGTHTLSFPASDQAGRPLASGIYFLRMDTPGRQEVRQVTVLR